MRGRIGSIWSTPAFAGIGIIAFALGSPAVAQQQAPPHQLLQEVEPDDPTQIAEYVVKDIVEGAYVNLNHFAVRPMVLLEDSDELFAVNTHDSTVEYFTGSNETPTAIYRVPWGPVSIAHWTGSDGNSPELLVVSRGSYALTRIDLLQKKISAVIRLRAEPADIVLNESTGRAFVSCSGADAVVQVNLADGSIEQVYNETNFPEFRIKHPLFLSMDDSGRVYVSPMMSGNNTTANRDNVNMGGALAANKVIDLTDPEFVDIQNGGGLPDEDLFRIDPTPGSESVDAVATGLGAAQFGNGFNPGSGKFWQLGTTAKNATDLQTEPEINGEFATNQLAIVVPGSGPALPTKIIDLDLASTNGAGPLNPDRTMGQPFALDFAPTGEGVIAGLLTDNIMVLRANGNFLFEWDLPAGLIPRAVHLREDLSELLVYCWGTNQIRVYNPFGTSLFRTHRLNHDPTPKSVKAGRALFYDGGKSRDNNLSCATCHIEGGTDFLVWNLSAGPIDSKGPMLTQTLRGIEKVQPLHWRGERPGLIDFNPAFVGLLGNDMELTPEEFAAFEDFVFSIQNPPNPNQHRLRKLVDTIQPPVQNDPNYQASAVNGQINWFALPTFGGLTCDECHAMPTGTNNDTFPDSASHAKPKRSHFKVASFQELWRRQQSSVDAKIYQQSGSASGSPTEGFERAFLGAGTSHAGLVRDLHSFIFAVNGGLFGNDPDLHDDFANFLHQMDQSIAPATTWALLLDVNSSTKTINDLRNYLVPQAIANPDRNCDIAVFGEILSPQSLTLVPRHWYFDRDLNGGAGGFRSDRSGDATRTLQDFLDQADIESNLFVGVPVGMGERFAIDYDLDGILNQDDGNPYKPTINLLDTVDPQFVATPSMPWESTKVARILFETNEPTRYEIDYQTTFGSQGTVQTQEFSKAHSALLTQLLPSSAGGGAAFPDVTFTYTGTVTVFDRRGNSSSAPFSFDTDPFIVNGNTVNQHIVSDLFWTQEVVDGSGTLHATATYEVANRRGGPPHLVLPDRIGVFRVLVNGEVSADFVPTGPGSGKADVVEIINAGGATKKLRFPGPFLIGSITDGSGLAQVGFDLPGLVTTDVVELEFEVVVTTTTDAARLATFATDLAETTACVANSGPFDFDCGNTGVNDCCGLLIPVDGGVTRKFSQWSFPDTPKDFRALKKDI